MTIFDWLCETGWARRGATMAIAALGVFVVGSKPAEAIPLLQLYADGGTYVGGSEESWVLNITAGSTFKIWAVSNGGDVNNVTLSVAWTGNFDASNLTIVASTTGSSLFTDTSVAATPTSSAVFSGGQGGTNPPIPDHGVFNQPPTVFWKEFSLGNFSGTDSPIADFTSGFDPANGPAANKFGQINAYEITVTQAVSLHFDLYGLKDAKQVKAPFSHDAVVGASSNPPEPGPTPVPEPASLALLAFGCVGLGGFGVRKRNKPAA